MKTPPSRRNYKALKDVPRSQILSHYQVEQAKQPDEYNRLTEMIENARNLWKWAPTLWYYLQSRCGKRYYSSPKAYEGEHSVFKPEKQDNLSIGLAGDWASYTHESAQVMMAMAEDDPDITLHLGDIYLVGMPDEVEENFDPRQGDWLRGKLGSFAIPGNHDMYSNGRGFFEVLLPGMGLFDQSGRMRQQQRGSFFCIELEHWRIIGLDTGTNSLGIPFIEMKFKTPTSIVTKQINWLKKRMRHLKPKPTIVCTHHQFQSVGHGEYDYKNLASQLRSVFGDQPILWFWGHEHRLGIFKYEAGNEKVVPHYGRCIGHGGMPATMPDAGHRNPNLVYVDDRINPAYQTEHFGYNGFALLRLIGSVAKVEYYDLNRVKVYEEAFQADEDGRILLTP